MKLTDEFLPIPGIYIFKCATNGKYYIGESLNIKKRFRFHRKYGEQVVHKAIAKYGLDAFDVDVYYFPSADKSLLLDLEEALIQKFDCLSPKGYNFCRRGTDVSGENNWMYRKTHSDEVKEGLSKRMQGRKASNEVKRKMSESRRGKDNGFHGKTHNSETKSKLSCLHRKTHTFLNPSDQPVAIENLKEFSESNGLSYDMMRKVSRGACKSHKGWKYFESQLL